MQGVCVNSVLLLQPRRFSQVDLEALFLALVAPGHFDRGMAKLALNMRLIQLGRRRRYANASCH